MSEEMEMITSTSERTIPDSLPVLPLRGTVAFPHTMMPLNIGQERSIQLVEDAMRGNRMLLMVAQKDENKEKSMPEDLYQIGSVGVIEQLVRANNGTLRIIVQGLERVKINEFTSLEPYLVANLTTLPDIIGEDVEIEALRRALLEAIKKLVGLIEELPNEIMSAAESLSNVKQLAYLTAFLMPLSTEVRQEVLEIDPLAAKMRRLIELVNHEVAVRELGQKITSDTKERLSKTQKDYFLREQVRSIQKELGEGAENPEVAELRRQLNEARLPPEARKEADRELERFATMPPGSSDHGIVRTYLGWLATLPWNKLSAGTIDIPHAMEILNEDHYDLEKIKERIVEYLAVKKLRQERQKKAETTKDNNQKDKKQFVHEPILCFVGPPGVGKTSLGQSIARALGRKFVRISLGGLHDEAEIRGHRRTYVGAMPGKIIQGIRSADTRDPLFMLDEIDKVGADWRGDPSSALLEVLDPSQNYSFSDNYLNVPFDLSQVLFIATANSLETIPPPLLDRMEVLRLAGYTDEEKIHIAEKYLVPKEVQAHGLKTKEITFDKDAVRVIIRNYTREAGVRNLGREIASVCRKVARKIAEGNTKPAQITAKSVENYLGRPHFYDEVAEQVSRPGVATGLAWTPVGGDVLFIEASIMPSQKEHLLLTGMLGDVMRESAQTALSFVRSNSKLLNFDPHIFEDKKIHLHVPAGATPKDGPSAGITMMTALASLVTNRCINDNLAMTGEITLRGKVLPVGGIKEKVLAAHRMGIKTLILPKRNERDIEDIPEELRKQLKFHFVDAAEDVLKIALQNNTKNNRK